MQVHKSNIRRCARRYLRWLEDQQWFQLEVNDKDEWLEPIKSIISKKYDCPASLWEAVIDHWQATRWGADTRPLIFKELYDLVDEYRNLKHITSTANFDS
ncbi:hypothetical protein CXF64_20275 [Pseudoalteromonas sp. GutCa3]|nr:hypothetical protein CXF64_20275 [Pseudoalteromonas sp. GutCa3]